MYSLLQLTVLCCLASLCLAHPHRPRNGNQQEGDSCTPYHVATCGNRTLVSENVTELTEGYGPNVCMTERVYAVRTYSYSYQMQCYRGWFGRRSCGLRCTCTNMCDGPVRNITVRKIDCCEGFTTQPQESTNLFEWLFYRSHSGSSKRVLRNEGCPMMVQDNVVDCLVQLNLLSFVDELVRLPELFNNQLQSDDSDSKYTIFAPSQNAFDELGDQASVVLSDTSVIEGHIADSEIPSKRLRQGRIVDTLVPDFSLHAATVYNRTSRNTRVYMNGALISQKDACQARNGIVHVMDSFIPLSGDTIAQVLMDEPSFSTFLRLLDAANITRFLAARSKSRTVFAPTNDAFNNLPAGAVECLLRPENSRKLNLLVLLHISYTAEYSSTLAFRRHVPTFTRYYLVISTNEAGNILVTRDEIPIQEADLAANNGVIHTLPEVIVPFEVNFEEDCPDIPSATTAAPPEPQTTPRIPVGPLPTDDPDPNPIEPSGDGPVSPIPIDVGDPLDELDV